MPKDVIQKLFANIKELERVNEELTSRLDEKGEELFQAMQDLCALKETAATNPYKPFLLVGERQQRWQKEK